jgi:TRAP transporter 4TM/12TM fusion protein
VFFFLYPLFAEHMPLFMYGQSVSFDRAIRAYVFGTQGLFGVTLKTVGDLLLGFIVFSAVLVHTGGAKFFLDLATALVGRARGGPAKVSVVASGFFGSMSGSVVANVAGTGAVTIPTMKAAGYSPRYAAAIEACASTGGVLMPPIMGAAAFLIAQILAIPYGEVVIAAVIPSLLYYVSLLLQVDAHAARQGLRGLVGTVPAISNTCRTGWHFLFALAFLVFGLLYLRWSAQTPYYASAILVLLSIVQPKKRRLNWNGFIQLILEAGRLVAEILALLLAIGFVLGALSVTGVGYSFARDVVSLTGGNVALLLGLGFFASFILGMGLTITACYVFLAVTLVPPLVAVGLNPLACHLFVMYCGMLSYITPPVALAALTAAGMAGSDPMRTGFLAMRLGVVIFFLPFFFVLNPAMIMQGPILLCLIHFAFALAGILLLAASVEGYLIGIGVLHTRVIRTLVFISGLLLAVPSWETKPIAALLIVPIIIWQIVNRRTRIQGRN